MYHNSNSVLAKRFLFLLNYVDKSKSAIKIKIKKNRFITKTYICSAVYKCYFYDTPILEFDTQHNNNYYERIGYILKQLNEHCNYCNIHLFKICCGGKYAIVKDMSLDKNGNIVLDCDLTINYYALNFSA